jgi:hypothetical protein
MYYYHLDWPNREEYTNYFNNEFIPKYVPDFSKKQTSPWGDYKFDGYWLFFPIQIQDTKIFELQDFLKRNFDFPDISYIMIFCSTKDLPIHIDGPEDGSTGVNHACLNLQLSGYEGATMQFFKKVVNTSGYLQGTSKVRAWNNNEVELIDQFDCFNTWSLLNTGTPHSVKVSDSGIPKICLSVRFKGFPTFEDSLAKIQSRTTLV